MVCRELSFVNPRPRFASPSPLISEKLQNRSIHFQNNILLQRKFQKDLFEKSELFQSFSKAQQSFVGNLTAKNYFQNYYFYLPRKMKFEM